jgi:recA bacterial DNA recombination protein
VRRMRSLSRKEVQASEDIPDSGTTTPAPDRSEEKGKKVFPPAFSQRIKQLMVYNTCYPPAQRTPVSTRSLQSIAPFYPSMQKAQCLAGTSHPGFCRMPPYKKRCGVSTSRWVGIRFDLQRIRNGKSSECGFPLHLHPRANCRRTACVVFAYYVHCKYRSHCRERIPTGCLTLDAALGGGVAKGRIIEIYGPESCGKTSLALSILAQAQKKYPDDVVALLDLEHAMDANFSRRLGVNQEFFVLSSPESGDKAFKVRVPTFLAHPTSLN